MSRSESWRRRLGPERVAAVVASVIVGFGSLGVASAMGASEGVPPPSAAVSGAAALSPTPAPTPHPFAATATLALQITERLAEDRHALEVELAAAHIDLPAVVSTVRRLNATARLGSDVAQSLAGESGARAVGTALGAFYEAVATAADETLATSLGRPTAYRAAAKRLLAVLKATASLHDDLEALIASTRATPRSATVATLPPSGSNPVAVATPSTSAPTPTPTPSARPSPTPSPNPVPPTIPPVVGVIQNPGFEATTASPWALFLESPAAGRLSVDADAISFEGDRSARVDVSVASQARTGISLRQGGIAVEQSHRYVCRLALRAAAPREVRIRVASVSGATYGTRLLTVGSTWTIVEFEFGSFVEDPAAVIAIDLGRSATTTWVDAVQIRDVSESVP